MGMDSSLAFRNHTMDYVAQFPLIKEDPRSGSGEHTPKEQDMCHPEHPSYTPSAEGSRDVPPASPSCSHVCGFQQSRHEVRHSSDRSGCTQDSSWGEIHADQGAPRVSCSFCSNVLRKSTLLQNSPLHRSLRGSKCLHPSHIQEGFQGWNPNLTALPGPGVFLSRVIWEKEEEN